MANSAFFSVARDRIDAIVHAAREPRNGTDAGRPGTTGPVVPVPPGGPHVADPHVTALSDSAERVAKFVGVGTVLLPLVGLVVRIVRFWGVPGGIDWMPRSLGLDIAAAQDVTHLATSGFHADFVLMQWVAIWAALGLLWGVLSIAPGTRSLLERVRGHKREFACLIAAAAVFAFVAYGWYSYPIVGAAALAVITLVGWWLIEQEVTGAGRPPWNSVIAAALAVGLAAAIASGSSYWQPQGEYLTFVAAGQGASIPPDAGWYGELGRTSDQVFLTRCDGSGTIQVVAPSEIATITYAATPPQTRNMGFGDGPWEWSAGFQPGCSHP